ncbi:hypothetical protein CTA1_2256 [Colletotrichum tanaceti]|uniref:Uncharacterized protein n=1 Tax=Colletotrichum tanaceti TaxID=1306861 RepID=A0A4U6XNA5_9PEZI|nr:hypothetical protein CTA1_2256 [Colletotrichum tanaceti]
MYGVAGRDVILLLRRGRVVLGSVDCRDVASEGRVHNGSKQLARLHLVELDAVSVSELGEIPGLVVLAGKGVWPPCFGVEHLAVFS